MWSIAVIESYLDGCKFNEVGCGCRSPLSGKKDGWKGRSGEAGREGGLEHKLSERSGSKALQMDVNDSCAGKAVKKKKSSASIRATQPVCQISAVICIGVVVRQVRAQNLFFFIDRKALGPRRNASVQRIRNCTWSCVCIMKARAQHLILQDWNLALAVCLASDVKWYKMSLLHRMSGLRFQHWNLSENIVLSWLIVLAIKTWQGISSVRWNTKL